MLKEFLMKRMLKAKGVPAEQIEMVTKLVQNNPDLFNKIAVEVQEEMKRGKDQMAASMAVMAKYQDELKKAVGK